MSSNAATLPNDNLRQSTLAGVGWASLAQVGKQGVQFIVAVILARILTPEDFGLVGMILVFTGFVILMGELGFGAAIIQRQTLEERHYSSIFWLNVLTGFALTGLVMIAAPLIARFYREPQLVALTRVLALSFAVNSFGVVQSAILNRAMKFRWLALLELAAVMVAGTIAIIVAVLDYGVWSLVWQVLLTSVLTTIGLWLVTGWRPQLLFEWAAVRDLVTFSGNLFGFNAFNYWARNADNLLIGRFMGTVELGIYTRAYSTMLLPLSQVTSVLGRVMFPALSRIQHDKVLVKQIYLRALALIALVTFPMMLGLFVTAESFVLTLFGPKWEGVVTLLQILSLVGLVQSLVATVGWLYQSQGRTDWMFRWGLFVGIVGIISFLIGLSLGTVESVAICYAIANVLLLYWNFTIPGRLIDLTFLEVVQRVSGMLGCALVMALLVWGFGRLLPPTWPHWGRLLLQAMVGSASYGLLVHLFNIQAYREARALFGEQWRTLRRGVAKSAN
jgi:O-antigen/teichoic acid export membrane protein